MLAAFRPEKQEGKRPASAVLIPLGLGYVGRGLLGGPGRRPPWLTGPASGCATTAVATAGRKPEVAVTRRSSHDVIHD